MTPTSAEERRDAHVLTGPGPLPILLTVSTVILLIGGCTTNLDDAIGSQATRAEQPNSIMLWVNMSHQEVVEEYLGDLRTVVADVRAGRLKAGDDSIIYVT